LIITIFKGIVHQKKKKILNVLRNTQVTRMNLIGSRMSSKQA